MKKPLLIATLGFPGSGKTYFSERFCKDFNFVHINSDKVRHEMFATMTYSVEENALLFRFIDWMTGEFLSKRISVIVDANSPLRIHRNAFAKQAKKYNADYIVLHVQTPVELAEKRLVKRRRVKSENKKKIYRPIEVSVLHTIKNMTEKPHKKEPVVMIDGTKSYSEQLKELKSKIKI